MIGSLDHRDKISTAVIMMETNSPNDGSVISLQTLGRIDKVCDEFEIAYRRNDRPRIEDFQREDKEPERSYELRALLLLECDLRQQQGEHPKLSDYLQRFPDHESTVRGAIAETVRRQQTHSFHPDPDAAAGDAMSFGAESDVPQSPRYQIRDKLGEGAFGSVYLAYDQELARLVAMKVPRKNHRMNVEQFLAEAKATARLSHPSIVAIHDFGRFPDGRPFLVTQYIEGQTLSEAMSTVAGSYSTIVDVVRQVAEGLQHAHRHGLVHRDLKPSNILVDKTGKPFLADFGLALHETDQAAHRGDTSGTPSYRSPEQVRGEADWIDGRSDIWATGVILYQLLVGRRPFRGKTIRQLDEEILRRDPKPPRQIDEAVPEWLEGVCLKCLSKSPEARYATADSLSKALALGPGKTQTSVQLSHDVTGNTIVSGGGNVVIFQSDMTRQQARKPIGVSLGDNPYKGLAAFDEQDADVFFGRQRQVERLWEMLRDLRTKTTVNRSTVRLLPILGPSGCGKSSVARAGLIAELARKPLPGANNCRVMVLTPGAEPVESLAFALARTVTGEPAPLEKAGEFERRLRTRKDTGECDGLRSIVSMLPDRSTSPVFLLVDQFEEVFSLCDSAEQRATFIELLLYAAKDPAGHTSVIITLRSDFIGETHDHHDLNQIIAEQGVLIPAMNDLELREAIKRPAEEAGFEFDDDFLNRMIDTTKDREGALPLLQFALTRVWKGIQADQKPAETLHEIGGVGGALAGEAQRVYESLSENDQEIARRAFLAMVQIGDGARLTRRRASVRSMVRVNDDIRHVHTVLSHFASPETRLVTLHGEADGDYAAEITHESLIDHWPQLQQWLDVSRDDIRFQRRVDVAAQDWSERGRPAGLLWRTPDLDLLRELQAEVDLTQLQAEFFEASDAQEKTEALRRRGRTRIYQGGSAIIAALAIVASFFAWDASRKEELARQNERIAEENASLATKQGEAAVATIETLARDVPRILQMIPEENATAAQKDILNTAILGLKDVATNVERTSYLAATAHRGLGDIYKDNGRLNKAVDEYQRSLELVAQSQKEYADKTWVPLENLARGEDSIGDVCLEQGKLEEARKHYLKAKAYREQWLATGQETERANYHLGSTHANLGRIYFRDESKYNDALVHFEEAARRRREFVDKHGTNVPRRQYGGALHYVGLAKRGLGRYEEAAADLLKSQEILSELLTEWEQEPGLQGEYLLAANVANGYAELGHTYLYMKRMEEAVAAFEQARIRLEELHQLLPRNDQIASRYWKSLYALATCLIDSDSARSENLFRQACDLADRVAIGKTASMLTFARCHQREKSTEIANDIVETYPENATRLYYAACGYALCTWSAQTETDAGSTERSGDAHMHRERALELLRSAIDKGYSNLFELRDNPELDAIRDTPAFQECLARIPAE